MALIQTNRSQTSVSQPVSNAAAKRQAETSAAARRSAAPRGKRIAGMAHIRNKEVIPFTRQAAGMLNAGMSIIAVVGTLQEQATHRGFRSLLADLRANIESGSPFSDGLAMYPDAFGEMYINMIRAGERSGQFAEIMKRLAILLDSSARLVRKVKSALTYPLVVMSMAFIIAGLLVTFVVPVFREMFEGFGSKLPGPTMVLVNISDFIGKRWYAVIGGFVLVTWLVRKWLRTPQGLRALHNRILRLPIFGDLIQKVVIARFARLLGQMLSSGVPILDAMSITARSAGNKIIEASLLASREAVEAGQTLSAAMEGRAFLPVLMIRMTAAGEKSGRLDEMLNNVADSYDDEVETMLATLTSLMEPFMMIFLGIVIGGIVIAMFLPIFQIGNVVSG